MAKKSIYTRRLGNVVSKQAKGSVGIYHVIPAQVNRWSVVAEGSVRPVKAFATKREAVIYAKERAGLKTGEVIVHGADGKIQSRVSY
jgi:hypothetical protein